jgi:hypothetical protein
LEHLLVAWGENDVFSDPIRDEVGAIFDKLKNTPRKLGRSGGGLSSSAGSEEKKVMSSQCD